MYGVCGFSILSRTCRQSTMIFQIVGYNLYPNIPLLWRTLWFPFESAIVLNWWAHSGSLMTDGSSKLWWESASSLENLRIQSEASQVGLAFALDTMHQAFLTAGIYKYLIRDYGDLQHLDRLDNTIKVGIHNCVIQVADKTNPFLCLDSGHIHGNYGVSHLSSGYTSNLQLGIGCHDHNFTGVFPVQNMATLALLILILINVPDSEFF